MTTQEEIDKYLDDLINKTEREIDVVFAKRTKTILEHLSNIQRVIDSGGELGRANVYNSIRYKQELQFIAQAIDEEYRSMYEKIQTFLVLMYLENYLRSGQLYEFESQSPMSYSIPSLETINQALLNPIAELTLSSLMNSHRNDTIRRINIEIGQGIQAGEGYGRIAERIEKELGFSSVKAKRVARTEGGKAQVLGRMASAEHASKYAKLTKLWSATLDSDVRTSHRQLDNQEADEDGYFHFKGYKAKGPHLFGVAKLDINCRCDVLFLVDGKRPKLRRAKKLDGGSEVIPYMSYKDWYKTLPQAA